MKRLLLGLLLSTVLLGISMDGSARFSDVEVGVSNTVRAGTVDILPGVAEWWKQDDEVAPCTSAALLVPIRNVGTLPLSYGVAGSVIGDLAEWVVVEIDPSSGYLEVGDTEGIVVEITLLCSAGVDNNVEQGRGTLKVTVVGANAGFSDREVWSTVFLAQVGETAQPEPSSRGERSSRAWNRRPFCRHWWWHPWCNE